MAQSIKLNDNTFLDTSGFYGEMKEADWAATSSSASGTELTDRASLSPGVWLVVGLTPSASTDTVAYNLRSVSGTTDIGTTAFFQGGSYRAIVWMFKVTATANVVLRSGGNAGITFSATDRGKLKFYKLASLAG